MTRSLPFLLAAFLFIAAPAAAAEKKVVVMIETSLGTMKLELYPDKAPLTVKNFVGYAEQKFYDGTLFHRVARNPAVIQGGGYELGMKEKKTRPPIKNESGNGLSNKPYTIAMARTDEPDSAAAQFYINLRDNDFLDRARAGDGVGYCVFGKVVEGSDVADKIGKVPTRQEVPVKDVLIKSVRVMEK